MYKNLNLLTPEERMDYFYKLKAKLGYTDRRICELLDVTPQGLHKWKVGKIVMKSSYLYALEALVKRANDEKYNVEPIMVNVTKQPDPYFFETTITVNVTHRIETYSDEEALDEFNNYGYNFIDTDCRLDWYDIIESEITMRLKDMDCVDTVLIEDSKYTITDKDDDEVFNSI